MRKPRNHQLDIVCKWLRYCNYIDLSAILKNLGFHRIAIYGMGMLGELLYENLQSTDITVKCVIDRNAAISIDYDVDILLPEEIAKQDGSLDAVIVTPVDYAGIREMLAQRVSCPILSLYDLIVDIDDLRCLFEATEHIESAGARLILFDLDNPLGCKQNLTPTEKRLVAHKASWTDYIRPDGADVQLLWSYYDDLPECSKEYIKGVYHVDGSNAEVINGVKYLCNIESEYFNVINNMRYTVGNPQEYQNTVHFYGNCIAVGAFTEDKYTIASQLQHKLQDSPLDGKTYRVLNHSNWGDFPDSMKQIPQSRLQAGDIVIVITHNLKGLRVFLNYGYLDSSINEVFASNHGLGEIFFDYCHMNHRGYRLMTERIYSLLSLPEDTLMKRRSDLKDVFLKDIRLNRRSGQSGRIGRGGRIGQSGNEVGQEAPVLNDYISYLHAERIAESGEIGGLVMNCNPFTLGHKFLVEEALKQCDYLYIFVVEEDKSFFPFADRLRLVENGVSEYANVKVLPSGNFIISSITFPEYFIKDTKPDVCIDASQDIRIFAHDIAPALNITKRFVGEEPLDPITNQYNQAMRDVLPDYGISVIIIPRRQSADGNPISASRVRQLLERKDFENIAQMVPASTLDYLKERFGEEAEEDSYA